MPKKYFIFTLGCQMNVSDSQRIAAKFEVLGYQSASEKEADLVIVNACSVRQKAVDRIWGKIKKWQAAKKQIILTGCVLPTDREKFAERKIRYRDFKNSDFSNTIPYNLSLITYVPIMTGCDNFCSYCAVPLTRGREISRPTDDITSEVIRAVKNGSKKILLLGQNVNSYQHGFVKLLKTIDNLSGNFEFNFISSNPHDMSDELIETLATLKKWPRELHLPLQSGDDEILRKMNRRYSSAQYLKLIENLKLKIPASPAGGKNLSLTTDIIVGFPGETKEQFNNTVKLCKKVGFDKAYIAQYSPRPGTAAARLKDDVSSIEKKRRWKILDKLINKQIW